MLEDEYPIISVRNTQDALEKTMKSWKIILSLIIKCTIKNTNDDYEKILHNNGTDYGRRKTVLLLFI